MAGANKILKSGQVVFRAGDAADGMYLVRKGLLVVYLEQEGKEVVLAKIGEGGMIGEMALFDRQPRSASVKAESDTEITLVSQDDFLKLMKQIPKWFVALMTALSGRLRTTNDRLKQVEATAAALKTGGVGPADAVGGIPQKPFQSTLRMLYVLELLWHRDGTKDGKDWCLQRQIAEDCLTKVFGESAARVNALLDLLAQELILTSKVDQYKNTVLALSNRAALRQFAEFLSNFTKTNPSLRVIPETTMTILTLLHKLGVKAAYDQYTCTFEDIVEEATAGGIDASGWAPNVKAMANYGESLKIVKTTSKSGFGLRVIKSEFPALMKSLNAFNRVSAAKLDT